MNISAQTDATNFPIQGFMPVLSESHDIASTVAAATIHTICGVEPILRLQQVLADLSMRCGQPSVMDDIGYFLTKPGSLKRIPHLLLISKAPVLDLERMTADDLVGSVLLYKYMMLGCSIGTFTTNDRSGRGTLVAPAALRTTLAERVSRMLMDRGALAVLISFRKEDVATDAESNGGRLPGCAAASDGTARWVWREREAPDHLLLERTYDGTLAKIGQRTRRNLRYYRKRAEAELGCVFLPAVQIDRREFLEFNRACMYAVSPRVAMWRYDSLSELSTPLLMGIKDKNGRWLSLLGGRRRQGWTEILWQMNRESAYSLSIVMRSYFIEHEIAQGMTKLYMEGGTSHPMKFAFVNDRVTDLVVMRRSWPTRLIRKVAKYLVKEDNELALMLLDKSLYGDASGTRPLAGSPEG